MKHSFCIILLLLANVACYAQWTPLKGPETHVAFLLDAGKNVIATTGDGVFRSNDDGLHWEVIPDLPRHYSVYAYANNLDNNQVVLVLRDEACNCLHFYKSTDQGDHWTKIATPGFAEYVSSIYSGNDGYILVSSSRVQDNQAIHTNWESFDGGKQWRRNHMDTLAESPIKALKRYGTSIWGYADNKLLKGALDGSDWKVVATTLDTFDVRGYLVIGDTILLNSINILYSKVWRSVDAGASWSELPYPYSILNFQQKGNVLLALGAYNQLLASHDQGVNWSVQSTDSIALSDFILKGDYLIGYELGTGVVRSDDLGKHFFRTQDRLGYASVPDQLTILDRQLFVTDPYSATLDKALPVYNLEQNSWEFRASPSPKFGFATFSDDIVQLDGRLFACMGTHETFRSVDKGLNWSPCTDLAQWPDVPTGTRMFSSNHSLFLYSTFWSTEHALYRSDDYGNTWIDLDFTDFSACNGNWNGLLAGNIGQTIFAAGKYGSCLFKSETMGNSWEAINLPEVLIQTDSGYAYITGLTMADHMLLLTMARYERQQRDYFNFVSNDLGQSWQTSDAPIGFRENNAINFPTCVTVDNFVLMSTYGAGVYVSQDTGKHWTPFNEGIPGLVTPDLVVDQDYVYTSVSGHGVWRRPLADLELLKDGTEPQTLLMNAGPNPTTGLLRLIVGTPLQKAHLEWFDMAGRLCSTQELVFTCQQAVVELPFANGSYVYRVTSETGAKASGKILLIR